MLAATYVLMPLDTQTAIGYKIARLKRQQQLQTNKNIMSVDLISSRYCSIRYWGAAEMSHKLDAGKYGRKFLLIAAILGILSFPFLIASCLFTCLYLL